MKNTALSASSAAIARQFLAVVAMVFSMLAGLAAPAMASDLPTVRLSDLPQNLVGKAIVVTGSVEGFTREEAEAAIKDRGGKSPGSVSAKTYCVVVGEDPGASKVTKATELGIPMIQADAFQKLLDTGSI
jgi:NAD-dependent DNA ligase